MNFVWEKIQVVNGEPSCKILIIARNRIYMEEWCRIHEINPRSGKVIMVTKDRDLLGIQGSYYVDLGTDNQDLRTLLERLKARDVIRPLLTPNIQLKGVITMPDPFYVKKNGDIIPLKDSPEDIREW